MEVTRELDRNFGRSITVEYKLPNGDWDSVRVSKGIEDHGVDRRWKSAVIHYSMSPASIGDITVFIKALMLAKKEAEWLDAEYPTGQPISGTK